jgi:hypothetical protein
MKLERSFEIVFNGIRISVLPVVIVVCSKGDISKLPKRTSNVCIFAFNEKLKALLTCARF